LLRFGVVFMLAESVFHFSALRISGARQLWPTSAWYYALLFNWLWASASLLIAIVLYYLQRDARRYRDLIGAVSWFGLFHAGVLTYFSTVSIEQKLILPSLYVWNPYYSVQLRLEAAVLVVFFAVVQFPLAKWVWRAVTSGGER